MKLVFISLITLIFGFQLLDCSKSTNQQPQQKPAYVGSYDYTGYDKNGAAAVKGTLEITSAEAGNVAGKWELRAVGSQNNIGPQTGTGTLSGAIEKDVWRIGLNPNMADNNVTLTGHYNDNTLSGTWTYSGFAGVLNSGKFEAKKK